jgi:2,3-bisphosphoglycerate-independent phosphoglycerate mutase
MSQDSKHPTVLIILDGFGVAPPSDGNAILKAKTPVFDRLIRHYPTMTLRASGEEVGLSWGEMGNSEVGHLAIGSGRVYYQSLPRIDRAIADGSFFENEVFEKAIQHAKERDTALHLIGIISKGGVHGLDEHAYALLEFAKKHGLKRVFVHAILDGRDAPLNSAVDFLTAIEAKMKELKIGSIASVSGRYYAMDRDERWDRTQKAYDAIVSAEGPTSPSALEAVRASYAKELFDERVLPTVIVKDGAPVGQVRDGDSIICFNFRPDRMRQLARALAVVPFEQIKQAPRNDLLIVTMTEYLNNLPVLVAFPLVTIDQTLAKVLSERGLKQLHVAETEKYAHVTFFLNGTHEQPFEGEDRKIIPSPNVATYDQAPEMSAREITRFVLKALQENKYDFVVLNFANADMVAHTGDMQATIKGLEVVDECIGKIVEDVLGREGTVFITSDHGNAEEMRNLRTGGILKEHANNPVPFVIVGKQFEGQPGLAGEVPDGDLSLMPPVGMLADIAPTVLSVMDIDQPDEMEGQALV